MTAIEVESRGPLSSEDLPRLKAILDKDGTFITIKNRIHLCYGGLDNLDNPQTNSELDIRAKITNGVPEMSIKIGKWGASEGREEISVVLQKGQFANLIRAYAALGFRKGLIALRNTLVYRYQDVEFALVEVPGHSWFFEAEIIASSEEGVDAAKKRIKEVCVSLDLKIFTDQEFWSYVDILNKSANKNWDFDKEGVDTFEEEFGID
ncbi:MAG TPA: hypothetical protein VJH22_03145 [Candidatus Nanoarchaeia archaeon]|nr:hypothetical protein [Candidatus Nanoarchaeia archaeon]